MTMVDERRMPAPPMWATALEIRAIGERLGLEAAMPALRQLPRGDGHTVIVLPGFTADDRSTQPLRHLLLDLVVRYAHDDRALQPARAACGRAQPDDPVSPPAGPARARP